MTAIIVPAEEWATWEQEREQANREHAIREREHKQRRDLQWIPELLDTIAILEMRAHLAEQFLAAALAMLERTCIISGPDQEHTTDGRTPMDQTPSHPSTTGLPNPPRARTNHHGMVPLTSPKVEPPRSRPKLP